MDGCLISICIPAYKRAQNIDRLLHSISIQTFTDFEIVITDDSPDEQLQPVIQKYGHLNIRYHKNEEALGTPANWNLGISLAKGEWIKIMHDDDWFTNENALQAFADATTKGKKFIFSRYVNVFASGKMEMPAFPEPWKKKIIRQPMFLLPRNVVGPPSVTLVHSSIKERYDERMKWRVDMDFYVRLLHQEKDFELVDAPLVNVGISESQVTNYCINEPEVELGEGWLLLHKYGVHPLKHLLIYDAWWRILRNTKIRNSKQLHQYTPSKQWPQVIIKMADQQSLIPPALLNFGPFSKTAMTLSYLRNKNYLAGP